MRRSDQADAHYLLHKAGAHTYAAESMCAEGRKLIGLKEVDGLISELTWMVRTLGLKRWAGTLLMFFATIAASLVIWSLLPHNLLSVSAVVLVCAIGGFTAFYHALDATFGMVTRLDEACRLHLEAARNAIAAAKSLVDAINDHLAWAKKKMTAGGIVLRELLRSIFQRPAGPSTGEESGLRAAPLSHGPPRRGEIANGFTPVFANEWPM